MQVLITTEQRSLMLANAMAEGPDKRPVVKLFCPWGAGTWLLSELDPDDESIAFGLCDLGFGCPELGYVSLDEVREVRGPGGLRIERDIHFKANKTLGDYADEARENQRIIA